MTWFPRPLCIPLFSTSLHIVSYFFFLNVLLTVSRFTKDEMQRELLENMYRTNELDELLKESDYTIRRRKECQQMVESLSRASEIVSQVQ